MVHVIPEKCKPKYCTQAWHPSPHVSLHRKKFQKECQFISLYDSGLILLGLWITKHLFAFSILIAVHVCPVQHFLSPSWPIPQFPPGYVGRESCKVTCLYNASSLGNTITFLRTHKGEQTQQRKYFWILRNRILLLKRNSATKDKFQSLLFILFCFVKFTSFSLGLGIGWVCFYLIFPVLHWFYIQKNNQSPFPISWRICKYVAKSNLCLLLFIYQ